MEMPQGVWKQHLRPRAVVGYGVKIFLPSPPNYVTRSPGRYERFRLGTTYDRKNFLLCFYLALIFFIERGFIQVTRKLEFSITS